MSPKEESEKGNRRGSCSVCDRSCVTSDLDLGLQNYFPQLEDGGEIGGSGLHFPSAPVNCLADLRNRVNSQRYSSIYEDERQKIVEDIERSDGKKSA